MSAALREAVLSEASSWLGTPFEHMQRCKGAGVDCGQFLIGVFYNVGIIPNLKTDYYPRDFHLHRDREWYTELVLNFSRELDSSEIPLPADLVLFKVGRIYSHGAIVVSWPRIIHSFVTRGVIWADGTQGQFMDKPRKFFRPFGLEA
jgi:cell wall-associated NlpC family hydrolase